ncbi:unnamed protein product [Arctia plantaginis]|uniref:Uncharacterized protein n=1 Tax=Arctia plantaginis TaxID=874455 RepID=A0A8S1AWB9_ARCPL|nr:unnamed protein product [Arctia plantaginis]
MSEESKWGKLSGIDQDTVCVSLNSGSRNERKCYRIALFSFKRGNSDLKNELPGRLATIVNNGELTEILEPDQYQTFQEITVI